MITQKTLARTAAGAPQYGFFLQSRVGATDGDPTSSDGIFVFMGTFTSLIGGYAPTVGDEVVLRARVSEFFSMTQLSGASLVSRLATGLDVNTAVAVDRRDATGRPGRRRPVLGAARGRCGCGYAAGSAVTGGRDVFGSTADSEIWLVDKDDPLLDRADPYARRVFRDPHPLDNDAGQRLRQRQRQPHPARQPRREGGWPATARRCCRRPATFDTLTGDAVGGLYYSLRQVRRAAGAGRVHRRPGPVGEHPPVPAANRERASSRWRRTTSRTSTTSATTRSTAATSSATPAAPG